MPEKTLEEEYREYLSTLSIQTLRTLGRKLGIPAECRKTKPSCVNGLLDLLMGRADPVPVSGKGAPVKQNYLDPSIIRRLEEMRLVRERQIERPVTTMTVSSGKKETSFYDRPVFTGILEMMSGGYGFLRAKNCQPTSGGDVFIAAPLIHSNKLREGDLVACTAKPSEKEEAAAFQELLSVNGIPCGDHEKRGSFDALTACYPEQRIPLSEKGKELSLRVIDLFSPIGKGQRALIIAPPKAGKTTLLKEIASACDRMRPNVELIVLLIDERPEEVTDIRRTVTSARVIYSTFDRGEHHHIHAASLTLEHAKRLVEAGKDVVILLDSITRLTRAYNAVTNSGRMLSGGLDPQALIEPRKFFGAARNTEDGGSLTIIATALVDTGSRLDDVIYEEFKAAGNMEIVLSRELAERRIFPAIDIKSSGARKEELLLSEKELDLSCRLRQMIGRQLNSEGLYALMNKTRTNAELIERAEKSGI